MSAPWDGVRLTGLFDASAGDTTSAAPFFSLTSACSLQATIGQILKLTLGRLQRNLGRRVVGQQ